MHQPPRSRFYVPAITAAFAASLASTAALAQVQGAVQVGFQQPVAGQVIAQPVAQPVVQQPVVQQPVVQQQFVRQPIAGQVIAQPVGGPVGPQQTVNVQLAPPPPPQQDRFVAPAQPGQRWIRGHWDWVNGQQQWIPGHWEMPPQQGYVWVDPQWTGRGRRYNFRRGYWAPPQQIGAQYLQPGAFGIQAQVRPYQPGDVVAGSLDTSDFHLPQGGYADDYAVFLQAGRPVTFVVTGGPATQAGQLLDVVASVHFQGRELASDDDGAGYPHARLVFTPPASGVYALRVTSYGSRFETGSYTIQSWLGAVANAQPFQMQPAQPMLPQGPQQQVYPGQPQQLYPGQPQQQVYPGQPQQVYPGQPQYPAQPQQVYPGQVQQVYPGQPQPQPQVMQMQLTQPGVAGQIMPLQLNTTVQGLLQQGDIVTPRGVFADRFVVTLNAGQPVTLVARGMRTVDPTRGNFPYDPDVMIDVMYGNTVVAHDDDSAGNRNARVVFTPAMPGQYLIQVSTFGGGQRAGAYTLTAMLGANPGAQ